MTARTFTGEFTGTVEAIETRATFIRTYDGKRALSRTATSTPTLGNAEMTAPAAPTVPFLDWWGGHVVASVDHRAVVEQVQEDAGWSPHFAFMTLMSGGIAVLGLLFLLRRS